MAGVSSIFFNVPQTAPTSLLLLSVFIDVEDESKKVTFRVTSPNPAKNPNSPVTCGPFSVGAGTVELPFGAATNPGGSYDMVVTPPAAAAIPPLNKRYQFYLFLYSDYDASCANVNQPAVTANQWKFEIVANADASPTTTILGVGVSSFNQPMCDNIYHPALTGSVATAGIFLNCALTNGSTTATIPLPDTAANLSDDMLVTGPNVPAGTTITMIDMTVSPNTIKLSNAPTATATQILQFAEPVSGVVNATDTFFSLPRLGVDAILVLDRSGSMASPAIDGQATPTRIGELQDSLKQFSSMWKTLRAAEGALTPTDDHIGVVIFETEAAWWPTLPSGLNTFNDALDATIESNVATITAGTSTSIGAGLDLATNNQTGFPTFDYSQNRRRIILVMSDGIENTAPFTSVLNNVVSTTTGALPNQDKYQIYAVTVGTSTQVMPRINQQISQATNGFYTNTESDATLLNPFFLEILQNLLHFTSIETFRMVHAALTSAAPVYSVTVPVTAATPAIAILLRTAQLRLRLSLTVTPPGEAPVQVSTVNGSVLRAFNANDFAAKSLLGDWKIDIGLGPDMPAGFLAEFGPAMFDLNVAGDDIGLHTELAIVPADYIPGQPIQLSASVVEFGRPVHGLGSKPGDRVVAEVLKPGIGVGDLLSDSTAPSTQPFPGDPASPAQAKLVNHLQANPGSLAQIEGDVVTLTDDGTGVYRGTYQVQTPGHYNFLFAVEGSSNSLGRFSRQQLKTVYVRAKPDGTATNIQTTTQTLTGGNQLAVTFTPRTSFGNRMGPGWANYFWLTTPGQTPFKAVDNLDGSYTATLLYTGFSAPPLTLNFIDAAVIIGDTVGPNQLPVPLGSGTVLVPFVNPAGGVLSLLPPIFWLLLIIAFLIGLVIGLLI